MPLKDKVQEERKAAGLLPYPNPPIPIPPKRERFGELFLGFFEDPDYERKDIGEQDLRFAYLCAMEGVLSLLRSPGFDALAPREQIAALFGRWPETQL